MKPEAQRIAIAEACGWKCSHEGKYCTASLDAPVPTVFDPLSDLNVMHEAEKMLLSKCDHGFNDDLWIDYLANLGLASRPCGSHHATAAQRAEAFLKTLSLWKDEA
jgi:hypothetical protein